MTPVVVDIVFEIAAVLLTFLIVLRSVPLLKRRNKSVTVALFIFAMVSLMLSFAYWLTYTLIRPETRMPIAANEIGEIAWLLLLASALDTVFRKREISAGKEIVFTIIFAAASVALWIGWSGEWIQDIIFGVAFGYFLCVCVRSLKQTAALDNPRWRILGIACGAIIAAQAATFFVSESFKQPMDYICYGLMFASLIWLFVKVILMAKNNRDTKAVLAMSFTLCGFSFSTLYMSAGWFYMVALGICLATLPLMFIALKREVAS